MSDETGPMLAIQIRIPRDLMNRLDRYRFGMPLRPTRSQAIRFLIENALNILEEGASTDE